MTVCACVRVRVCVNRILTPHARQSCPKALMARGSQNADLVSCSRGIFCADGKPWVCRHAAGAPHGVVYSVHFEPGRESKLVPTRCTRLTKEYLAHISILGQVPDGGSLLLVMSLLSLPGAVVTVIPGCHLGDCISQAGPCTPLGSQSPSGSPCYDRGHKPAQVCE